MGMVVKKGQLTFDAEGNDIENSAYFSRVIHWPGNSASGITIGRGYDLGQRFRSDVLNDMVDAGISAHKSQAIAEGAGLIGEAARIFVESNKDSIGAITHEQQVKLFDNIYPTYEVRAKRNYRKWTSLQQNRVDWCGLHPAIRDVLVDFVYQGFTRGPNPMRAGMNNSFDELIYYIENTPAIRRYEAGRRRANYLRQRKRQ